MENESVKIDCAAGESNSNQPPDATEIKISSISNPPAPPDNTTVSQPLKKHVYYRIFFSFCLTWMLTSQMMTIAVY